MRKKQRIAALKASQEAELEGKDHRSPVIKARLADAATTPMVFTPAEFGAYMAAETEKWGKVIRAAGIKPE